MTHALAGADVMNIIAASCQGLQAERKDYERRMSDARITLLRIAVKEDLLSLWGRRILTALSNERTYVTSRWWFGNRWNVERTADAYITVLNELLGYDKFQVTLEFTRFNRPYVKVSWE